jgi:hypothetical protein
LLAAVRSERPARERLRALWALHVAGGLKEETAVSLMSDRDEYLRAWAVQLMAEDRTLGPQALQAMARRAKEDASPVVRLYLASALQRIEPAQRVPVLTELLAHAEDAQDHNLPLM